MDCRIEQHGVELATPDHPAATPLRHPHRRPAGFDARAIDPDVRHVESEVELGEEREGVRNQPARTGLVPREVGSVEHETALRQLRIRSLEPQGGGCTGRTTTDDDDVAVLHGTAPSSAVSRLRGGGCSPAPSG